MGSKNADTSSTHLHARRFRLEAWRDQALQLRDHVPKGKQIRVTGRLVEDRYTDNAGHNKAIVKVVVNTIALLESERRAPVQREASFEHHQQGTHSYQEHTPSPPHAFNQQTGHTGLSNTLQSSTRAAPLVGTDTSEQSWRALFENFHDWWDMRGHKNTPKSPDFKHRTDGTSLWIRDYKTPAWVASSLHQLPSPQLPSHAAAGHHNDSSQHSTYAGTANVPNVTREPYDDPPF